MTTPRFCTCCGQALPETAGRVLFDEAAGIIMIDGEQYGPFPRLDFNIARLLLSRAPTLVTHAQIFDVLYGHDIDGGPDPKIVQVRLCSVRRALAGSAVHIETRWGVGYRAMLRAVPSTGFTRTQPAEASA